MALTEKQKEVFDQTREMLEKFYGRQKDVHILENKDKAFIIMKITDDPSIMFEAQPFKKDAVLVFRAFILMDVEIDSEVIKKVSKINTELNFGSFNFVFGRKKKPNLMFKYCALASQLSDKYINTLISEIIFYSGKYMPQLLEYGTQPAEDIEKNLGKHAKKN